jgi:hypothetical protein
LLGILLLSDQPLLGVGIRELKCIILHFFPLSCPINVPVLVSLILSSHTFTLSLGTDPCIAGLTLTFKTEIGHQHRRMSRI